MDYNCQLRRFGTKSAADFGQELANHILARNYDSTDALSRYHEIRNIVNDVGGNILMRNQPGTENQHRTIIAVAVQHAGFWTKNAGFWKNISVDNTSTALKCFK